MPWPFRKSKEATGSAAPPPAPSEPRPITAADLAPPRLALPVPRAWATLPPIARTVAPPSANLAAPQASFVGSVAGTQSLIQAPVLRHVTADAPAGRADDIVAAGRSLASPSLPGAPSPAEGAGAHNVSRPRRPVPSRSGTAPTRRRLDAYEGELHPYERPEYEALPEEWMSEAPAPADEDIPEELPPPIFSAILAERTGRSLAELRPDLADEHGNIIEEAPAPTPQPGAPRRRISPAEMKRMGLGAPQHSDAAASVEADAAPAPPPSPPPGPETAAADDLVEEVVTFEEFVARQQAAAQEPAETEQDEQPPELADEPGPRPDRRPSLRFRAAPGAPLRRLSADQIPTLRQTVPEDVRQAVHRATGVDPEATTVYRGPEASAEATRIGAAAFVRDGEIFLPAEHGPLDAPATRAVLAHELTHVVQHRVYGDRLPRADSPAGRRLESEARSVQRWVAGADDAPKLKPFATARAETPAGPALGDELRATADELVRSGLAHWTPDGTLVFGGGEMGGLGEPWMAVPSTLEAAVVEDQRLYEILQNDQDFGRDTTESMREYMEYHREFTETYRTDLQTTVSGATMVGGGGTTGLGTTTTGANTLEGLRQKLADLQAAHDEEPIPDIVGGGPFGLFADPYAAQEMKAARERAKKEAAFEKQRAEIQKQIANLDKERDEHTEAARVARQTRTTGGAGLQPLVQAPLAGQGVGDAIGGRLATGAGARTAAALTESQLLEQEMKDQLKAWQLEDQLAKLNESYYEQPIPDVVGGGPGGLFADPYRAQEMKAEREQQRKDRDFDRQRRTLEYQIRQQERIDSVKAREQQRATQTQQRTEQRQQAADNRAALRAGVPTAPLTGDEQTLSTSSARTDDPGNVVDQLEDEDVEELANILYSRLVTRLRRELIIDRERAGLLTDFR